MVKVNMKKITVSVYKDRKKEITILEPTKDKKKEPWKPSTQPVNRNLFYVKEGKTYIHYENENRCPDACTPSCCNIG